MKQITELRASKLARPMVCAGSLQFDETQESNEAAKEGTAAGEWMRRILDPVWAATQDPDVASNGVRYDDDMKFYANEIAQDILENAKGNEVICEREVNWQTRSGIVINGHPDAEYERLDEDTLYIEDLKYGWIHVEVVENWQLLDYAIGSVIKRQKAFKYIVMRVRQPRPHHEDGPKREWKITYEQLLEYKEQIEAKCDQLSAGFAELSTGKQCKYCPGAAEKCPAFNKALHSGIDYILSDFKQDGLMEREISFQLDLMSRIGDVFKIKQSSLEALAVDRIKNGKIIPNYVTEQNLGDRKWKTSVSPDVIKTLTGVDIVKKDMMSPAQAEKMGVPKSLVALNVERFFIGVKLKRKDASKLAKQIFGGK